MRTLPFVVLAVGLVAGSSALQAGSPEGPITPVQEAYRLEQLTLADGSANEPAWSAAHRKGLLTPGLAALFAVDDKFEQESQGMGNLEFDPLLDGQDGEIKALTLTSTEPVDGKARVSAKFTSFKIRQSVDFAVVLEGGRWLIDDILPSSHGQRMSVRTILSAPYPCGSTTNKAC